MTKATARAMARWRRLAGNSGSTRAQERVDAAEEREPAGVLVRRPFGRPDVARIFQKQFVDGDAAAIFGARLARLQHEEWHDDGAAPVGDLLR